MFVLMFIAFFITWKDSENRRKREFAIVCLAIASALKLYPAILGILLIRDKRYEDCIKAMIYFLILFVIPFLIFKGGFSNIPLFFDGLSVFSEENTIGFNPNDLCITKTFRSFAMLLGASQDAASILGLGMSIAFAILACLVIISVDDELKAIILSMIVLMIVPSPNYTYSMIYMYVPLSLILNRLSDSKLHTDSRKELFFMLATIVIWYAFILGFEFVLLAYALYITYKTFKGWSPPWSWMISVYSFSLLSFSLASHLYVETMSPYLHQIVLASSMIILGTYLVATNFKKAVKYGHKLRACNE